MIVISSERVSDAVEFTPRQLQLLEMLAEGKSNKEIASDLKITYGTVKQHLFMLFRKIDVTNRSKASIVAQQLLKSGLRHASRQRTSRSAPVGYQWRLISAAAFAVADHQALTTVELAQKDIFLSSLHAEIERLVTALDGQHMSLPDGGTLVWFGHPRAHEDDAERALYLVQCMLRWRQQQLPLPSAMDQFSIGVASHSEVVAENAQQLYAIKAFSVAVSLANLAKKLPYPLASQLTQRLCSDTGGWVKLQPVAKLADGQTKQRQDVYGLIFDQSPGTDLPQRWGGLPFMPTLCQSVASGAAQWLEVSSWTPASVASLLEAIGSMAAADAFRIFRVRLPSTKSRDVLLSSLAVQIDTAFGENPTGARSLRLSAGERLAERLAAVADESPLCILLYGHQSLDVFRSILTVKGVERLATKSIMLVGATPADGKSKAMIRTLGPRATGMPFSRVYTLELPTFVQQEEGLRAAVQSLLDDVSPLAKDIMLRAARQKNTLLKTVLDGFDNPHHEIQSALQELTALGMLVPTQGGGVQFRDPMIGEAIRQLDIPTDALPI